MTKTQNYNLNQWDPTDPIRREDFNADNAAIDAALGEMSTAVPKIACGTYSGNRTASRTISVGFTPKVVYLCTEDGRTFMISGSTSFLWGGLALANHPLSMNGENAVEIVDGGFKVAYNETSYSNTILVTNGSGSNYHYLAIG